MDLLCIGVSHKSAPIELRERLALSEEAQVQLLQRFAPIGEAMLLSTCNRVELYLAAEDLAAARQCATAALQEVAGAPEVLHHLYEHQGERAALHLFRVASSLDSMVVGEPQILGQVKDAFELAQKIGSARGELTRACNAAFGCAKRVRTDTGIGRAAVSMASAAVELAGKIFGGLAGANVLVVGAGEMAALAARHLQHAGAKRLVVANRTLARAEALAKEVGGVARSLDDLGALLVTADVVVSSTGALRPLFTRELVAQAQKARRHRPLFLVDLAVPRDIAPDVHELDGVYAYDVDDVQKVVADNAAARVAEAAKAEALVAEELARFVRARAVRAQVPVLAQLRAHAEKIARAEVERTLAKLRDLDERERQSIAAMAQAIVNKILHAPTMRLRALDDGGERLADAAAQLFGLAAEPAVLPEADDAANREAPRAQGVKG
ncbi:MAG: glutamyl-tRNA reductase [Myxococcaceae bacterium]|nr:glutamyl-tRNA reductase [Myxococcaceae bacterium]